jgi:RimJ/RimL family protein N-acetyltransferase
VRRHWYDIETTDALRMSVYFDRNPKDRSKRRCWWLYTLTLPEPVIVTKRLALRRWTFADRNIFFAMVRDPHVMTHLHDLRPMSEKEADAALSDTIDRYPGGFGDWAIVELTTGDIIGESGLTAGEKDDIEITWILLPRYWGCGFGFESAAAVKAYALEHVRLQRLVAFIRPDNRPSQRIAEKLGMHNMGLKDRAGQAMLEYEFRP